MFCAPVFCLIQWFFSLHKSSSCSWRVRRFAVPWSSRWSWTLHLFLGLPIFLRPFGLYCSACFGSLFVSILCTCCSHFFWYSTKRKVINLLYEVKFVSSTAQSEHFEHHEHNGSFNLTNLILCLHLNYTQNRDWFSHYVILWMKQRPGCAIQSNQHSQTWLSASLWENLLIKHEAFWVTNLHSVIACYQISGEMFCRHVYPRK